MIGKELYCTQVGSISSKWILWYRLKYGVVPEPIKFPAVGKLYHIRSVCKYKDTDYLSVTLEEVVNPAGYCQGLEPHFPITWFADLAEISIEELVGEEALA